MTVAPEFAEFWAGFEEHLGAKAASRCYESMHFDDNEPSANELAQLTLAGTKRATAGLLWTCEAEGRPPPKPGDLSIVTDWERQPLCVIETRRIDVVPFESVGADFAAAEGEGDGSLAYWQRVHRDCFERECSRIGRVPSPTMPVLCERFAVVYAVARGRLEVEMQPLEEAAVESGVSLGRLALNKRFDGDLSGMGRGQMLTAMTPVAGSAGYVAIERVSGTLHGRAGSFALQHSGTMDRGAQRLSFSVVADSGTGALAGLTGSLRVRIAEGRHDYEFGYSLAEPAAALEPA